MGKYASLCRQGSGGHEGKKTLRQLQAEQDDEERFQADLEQAMRQSLGESQQFQYLPLNENQN